MARPQDALSSYSARLPGAEAETGTGAGSEADPASGFARSFAVTGRPWLAASLAGLRRHESP